MPIQSCTLPNGKSGFRWGQHGKCYTSRADAEKQAQAAYANGYTEKTSLLGLLRKREERTDLCALLRKADWNEEDHPRDEDGKFSGGGRSLEERLKFDHGFTVGGGHGVNLSAPSGQTRSGVVHIPAKGYPKLTVKGSVHGAPVLTHFSVRGDTLKNEGQTTKPSAIQEFDDLVSRERVSVHIHLVSKLSKILDLDHAAHEAATSTLNLKPQPTEAQRHAGNYPKGHVRFAGLDVSIENPAGSYRRPEWPPMQAHYGYVRGSTGADGDHVDCFVRPATPLDWDGTAYVIDQQDADGTFDEHKVMLGYDNQEQAEAAYLAHYPSDWKLGPVTAMSLDELRSWLADDTTGPLKKEFTQSASATSGITAYGTVRNTAPKRKKRRARLAAAGEVR